MSLAIAANTRSGTQPQNGFLEDVVHGLGQLPKTLSAKYFYDQRGSQYFDEICHLEEYYIYKAELKLLPKVARELNDIIPEPVDIVEFGAGSVHKIRPLLKNFESIQRFTAIDICGEHLQCACASLHRQFPKIDIQAVEADFSQPLQLPASTHNAMGFFPGSTIGNFTPSDALQFLTTARLSLGENAWFLVGVDTKKSPVKLHQAYNDRQGVTAKFNLNILQRINSELNSDFDLEKFEHYAYYNAERGRIEMHLVSLAEQSYQLGEKQIHFSPGESIHTENSYKYTPQEFTELAANAGWHCSKLWLAQDDMFCTYLLRA